MRKCAPSQGRPSGSVAVIGIAAPATSADNAIASMIEETARHSP